MVIVWVSIVMAELKDSQALPDEELMYAMIAALYCVVPFLCEYATNATMPSTTRVNI